MQAGAAGGLSDNVNFKQIFTVVRKRLGFVLVFIILATTATAIYTWKQPRIYRAQGTMILDSATPKVFGDQVQSVVDESGGKFYTNKEFFNTQFEIIKSRPLAERVVERLGLNADLDFIYLGQIPSDSRNKIHNVQKTAASLIKRIEVKLVKDTKVAQVIVEDRDPKRAALIANTIVDTYLTYNLESRLAITREASDWLAEQIADMKVRLSNSEMDLFNFKRDNNILTVALEDTDKLAAEGLNQLHTRYMTQKADRITIEQTVKNIRETIKNSGRLEIFGEAASQSDVVRELRAREAAIVEELTDLESQYGDLHPKVKSTRDRLKFVRDSLDKELRSILTNLELKLKTTIEIEEKFLQLYNNERERVFEASKKEIEFNRLKREAENNSNLYNMLLKRAKETHLAGLLNTNNVRRLEPALAPTRASKPNVQLNLALGFFAGLMLGLIGAFTWETLDSTIKGVQDIEAMNLSVIGVIPLVKSGRRDQIRNPDLDLYIHDNPKSTVAEFCRSIRTNLLFMSPDKPMRRLLITSSNPREGKTVTSCYMGITMAQSGGRTLLIDCDMRRPSLHKAFGLTRVTQGLSNLILGDCKLDDVVIKSRVDNLWILPVGSIPPNPAELLHTDSFLRIIDEACNKFDRVIIDSPPLGPVADSLVIATHMDGVVVVVQPEKTSRDLTKRVVSGLRDVKANILGVIFNQVDIERRQYGYRYYYGGQYYYYYADREDREGGKDGKGKDSPPPGSGGQDDKRAAA
ncbi:MAG: hypothetical protein GMKNLPBB_00278 [Myxococcota bacterium]|nr:hypothetical protein [Myxococcota bacterium]